MLTSLIQIGHSASDSARDRRIKSIFATAMIGFTLFPLQLTFLEDRTALELVIDWSAMFGTVGALIVLQLSKRIDLAFNFVAGVALVVLLAALLTVGNRYGSVFFLIAVPINAVALLGAKRSRPWFAATLLVILVTAIGETIVPEYASVYHQSEANPEGLLFRSPVKEPLTREALIGLVMSMTLVYFVAYSAQYALQQANERIGGLLLNVLPSSIAARLTEETGQKLQERGAGIADEYSEATILFADIVGFTDLAARTTTAELMAILDKVFTEFDRLVEKHQVEKIKTIGDAYMAVCGLPEPNPDHAANIADMAMEMLEAVDRYSRESGIVIRLRIGINSGPVIAGIVGRKKFIYDLWGDAVNVASRMESNSQPDVVQTSASTREALKATHEFEPLDDVEIKGKGQMSAWRLVGRKHG